MNLPNVFGGIIRQLFAKILDGQVDAIAAYANVENEGEIRIDRMTGDKIMMLSNNMISHMQKFAMAQGVPERRLTDKWFLCIPIYHRLPEARLQQTLKLGRMR